MKKFLALLLLTATCLAQTANLSGGLIYNVREDDAGFWAETGLDFKKVSGEVGFSDMLQDAYRYREVEAFGRFWLTKNFAVEAGNGWGLSCRFAVPANCDHEHARWLAPFAGVAYKQKFSKHLGFIVRGDITPTQLPGKPFTHGKDDGLRVRFGITVTP